MPELTYPNIEIGQPLLNGAVCVDFAKVDDAHGIVLAVRTDMPGTAIAVDKWVTWEFNPQGETYWGHYHDNLNDAVRDFNARIGG